MPHSIFFMKDGHAIHGSFDVKNLGNPVSHGCVRISPQNAATLYKLVKENGLENTQVVVTGVSPGGEYQVARGQTSPRGVIPGALAFLITMDPRVTMDRHGPFHLGEGQAVALIGDGLGGVRWRKMQTLGESAFPCRDGLRNYYRAIASSRN